MASSEGNIDDYCRLCACETMTGVIIYSPEGFHLSLKEKILQCLRIEVSKDDVLPNKICCPCQSRLEESYQFAKQANKVQHTLQLLIQKMKQNMSMQRKEDIYVKHEIEDFPSDISTETASEGKYESNEQNENYIKDTSTETASEGRNNSIEQNENYIKDTSTETASEGRNDSFEQSENYMKDTSTETASEGKNESIEQYENYIREKIKSQPNKNKRKKRVAKKAAAYSGKFTNRRKMQKPQKSSSGLQTHAKKANQRNISSVSSSSARIQKVEREFQQEVESSDDDVAEVKKNREADDYEDVKNQGFEEEMKIKRNVSGTLIVYEAYKLEDIQEVNLQKSGSTWNNAAEEKEEEMYEVAKRNPEKSGKEEWRTHWGIKCNECNKVFPYRSQFDKHYTTLYNRMPVYTCSFCNKTMEKYSTFRSHCYRHVTEGRYRCEYCQKGFSLRSMLHAHILAKHSAVKPFTCIECDKGFVTRSSLNIHLKKHKPDEKQEYPCSECGKILRTRGGLTAHESVHRLGRRFMCDVCGKTFTQKVNLQQHSKSHTGERPFACHLCGKRFLEKSHLNRHYSFHSEKRPFQCSVCLKMYKTERCLKVHAMVHSEARPYVCSFCNKGFLSSTKLKQHYNIHTGERPYACKFCERTFTNYPNYLKHTRRRHKELIQSGSSTQNSSQPMQQQQHLPHLQHQLQHQQHQPEHQQHLHQHSDHPPDIGNSFESNRISLQTRLSDASSQLTESSLDPNSAPPMGMLHHYSPNNHSNLVQNVSPHKTQESPVTQQPPHHNVQQTSFCLSQGYPEHLMPIHMPHPESILPL